MNNNKLSQHIEDSLVSFLSDLDKRFKGTKKSATQVEKQIIQLLLSQVMDSAQFHEDNVFFNLPFSGEIAWINLNWPIDLDPNLKNQIKRKIKNIELKLQTPEIFNWDYEVNKDFKVFTVQEVFKLNSLNLIKPATWQKVEEHIYLLYRKDKEYRVSQSQFHFKMFCLLKYREANKNKTQEMIFGDSESEILKYASARRLFNEAERKEFRKRTLEQHYLQPGLIRIRGTSLEGLMNDSLLGAHQNHAIFYEEESHRQGYDIEVITPGFKSIRISSKTGNFSKIGVVHISSSRTQKLATLDDKIKKINDELDSISIITACISIVEGNRKKYLRLVLDPNKVKVSKNNKAWITQNEKNKDKTHGWDRYIFDNNKFTVTISEGKSHQVDFYIPLSLFDKVDEFYID